MRTNSKTRGYIVRGATVAVLVMSALVTLSSVVKPAAQARSLTFAERVTYQRAIEEVYWRHRIWPKENSKPKASLDGVI